MNDQRIGIEGIVTKVDTAFTSLDQQRSQGLERLQLIQSVQNTAQEREQQRLITKYGGDHPRVQEISARLTYNQGLRKDLAREIDRSKITAPQFDPSTWQGHGLVLDKNAVGIKGLTVSFADGKGTWIQALGYACTNEQGYFSITYPAQIGQTPSIPDPQPVFLTVTDQNRRILHRELTPRYVKIGQIDFWRIEITEDRGCETPPEPGTSSTAVKILIIHAPGKLIVNQAGSFTARVNEEATPPVASRWDFGDGATATGLTATHSYAKAGAYTVTFMASNDGGTDTKSVIVHVQVSPVAARILRLLAVPTNPTPQTPVRFSADVEGDAPVKYQWDLGDGNTSTELNPSHTYNDPNIYTVSLKVSNTAGSDSRSLRIVIASPDPNAWMVRGRITDESGDGLGGLIVSVYDKDLVFDDRLGETVTDESGNYLLAYRTEDFRDLIENKPDIYVKIMDRNRKTLYTSKETIRYEAGRVEIINVKIKKRAWLVDFLFGKE